MASKQSTFSTKNDKYRFKIPSMKASVQVSYVHCYVNILSCWECSLVALWRLDMPNVQFYLWHPSFAFYRLADEWMPIPSSSTSSVGWVLSTEHLHGVHTGFFQIRIWRKLQALDTAAVFDTLVDREKPSYKLKCSTKAWLESLANKQYCRKLTKYISEHTSHSFLH